MCTRAIEFHFFSEMFQKIFKVDFKSSIAKFRSQIIYHFFVLFSLPHGLIKVYQIYMVERQEYFAHNVNFLHLDQYMVFILDGIS